MPQTLNRTAGISTREICHFRLIKTPCCGHLLCWVNPRLPNYCPECGAKTYMKLKTDGSHIHLSDETAELRVKDVPQGCLGGFQAPLSWDDFQAMFPDQDYSDVFDDRTLTELLETGSVTVQVKRQKYVVSVKAEHDYIADEG